MTTDSAYYQLLTRTTQSDQSVKADYKSNIHAQGAWNDHEQHIGPVTGIICTEMERYQPREGMQVARISVDILGVIPFGEISIVSKTIRAGRTIELIESTAIVNDRACVIARAWRMMTNDSSSVYGLEDSKIVAPESLPVVGVMAEWNGGFMESLITRAECKSQKGKGLVWITTETEMIVDEDNSDFVKLMGLVDLANGVAPRIEPSSNKQWVYPNIDLQIHMHRLPKGKWLGIEAVQQIGMDGIGLTSAILHDIHGVFGRSEQILAVRSLD